MYDDVPSCGYLLPLASHDLSHAPADAVAHYCAAERPLDAESEPALRLLVRAIENGEVGTRSALPGAVHHVKIRLANQTRFPRILLPVFIRA
jgi:hypothetical protein